MTIEDRVKIIISKMKADMLWLEHQVTTTPAGEMCLKNIYGRLDHFSSELEKCLEPETIVDVMKMINTDRDGGVIGSTDLQKDGGENKNGKATVK